MPNQLIKLFFSEDDSENDLVRELEEENRKDTARVTIKDCPCDV